MDDWLAAQARANPNGIALTFAGAEWTWRALHADVDALCSRLASLKMKAGCIIAIHLPATPFAAQMVHAAARMGCVLAPLNTRLAHAELRAQLNLLEADALICDDLSLRDAMRDAVGMALSMDEVLALPAIEHRPQPMTLDRVQAIVFTSGSSGDPKGVTLTFGNHFYSALASSARLGTLPDDRWLTCLPLYHVGGLSVLFRAALHGFTVALHERFDVECIQACICRRHAVTLVSLVPTMLKRLIDANATWPATMRVVLLGGAAAPASLMAQARSNGIPVATTYGLTEAASQVATQSPQATLRKPASVGRPLLFTQVRIADEMGNTLPANATGEVVVSGPTVMREYLTKLQQPLHARCAMANYSPATLAISMRMATSFSCNAAVI